MNQRTSMLRLGELCYPTNCPAVYLPDPENFVVVGYLEEGLEIPAGEAAVRLPRSVVIEAVLKAAKGRVTMEPDEFAGLFKSFQRSAFRLETLSYYAVEGELELLFRRFLEGEPRPPLEEWAAGKGWVDLVSGGIAAGKAFQRVHLIRGPLTDYLRFEIEWGYLYSAPLGEEFRILSIGQDETLDDLPHEDFWLFDDNLAISMVYDDEGRFVGAMAVVDSAALETYRRRRDSALARSVPLEEYLAALAGSSSA